LQADLAQTELAKARAAEKRQSEAEARWKWMGRKTTVPILTPRSVSTKSRGDIRPLVRTPSAVASQRLQQQAADKCACRKETSSGSLGGPHRPLSAMGVLGSGGGSQDLGFTFQEGANQRCEGPPLQTPAVCSPSRAGRRAPASTRPMPALHPQPRSGAKRLLGNGRVCLQSKAGRRVWWQRVQGSA